MAKKINQVNIDKTNSININDILIKLDNLRSNLSSLETSLLTAGTTNCEVVNTFTNTKYNDILTQLTNHSTQLESSIETLGTGLLSEIDTMLDELGGGSVDLSGIEASLTSIESKIDELLSALGDGDAEAPYLPAPETTYTSVAVYRPPLNTYYSSTARSGFEVYFTCNDEENAVIKLTLTMFSTSSMSNAQIQIYLNDVELHSELFDLETTAKEYTFLLFHRTTRTDNKIHYLISPSLYQRIDIQNVEWEIMAKNINFLQNYPMYSIYSMNTTYKILKHQNNNVYYYETDQNNLDLTGTYTTLVSGTWCRYELLQYSTPNALGTVSNFLLQAFAVKNLVTKSHQTYDSNLVLRNTTANYWNTFLLGMTDGTRFSYGMAKTNTCKYKIACITLDQLTSFSLVNSEYTMPYEIVQTTTCPSFATKYSKSNIPIFIITYRNGLNFLMNHYNSNSIELGYGTRVNAKFYGTLDLFIRVYMFVYDHWVRKDIGVENNLLVFKDIVTTTWTFDQVLQGNDDEIFYVTNNQLSKLT